MKTTRSACIGLLYFVVSSPVNWAQAPPPELSITVFVDDSTAVLSWPGTATGFVLETASELSGQSAWRAVAKPPSLQAGNFSLAVPVTGSAQFFRLRLLFPGGLPPNPATVAPQVDRGVATDVASASVFLYTGPNPIQIGVTNGTIALRRAAVLRGKVLERDNSPLSGVTISILNHPEFGWTLTRADGLFDLAVNGGGLLTVKYDKPGYCPAQRQINASWQDYAWLPDVVLIRRDSHVTAIDLTANLPTQVARGSVVSDADGVRQATLLFPQGVAATMELPGGVTRDLTTLRIRATEYTVGPNGPHAMPAPLPPNSGYTYAVEFSSLENEAAGSTHVRFSRPIPFYLENFLGWPVGVVVPLGYYDQARGLWVSSESGRVIQILTITAGIAELDTDGDGLADSGTALGVAEAERAQLASLYQPGQTLWRMPIPFFTQSWDANTNTDADGAGEPPKDPPRVGQSDNAPDCQQAASFLECQNQILGEAVGLTGSPFSLHYQSDRVLGRATARTLEIPLSGDTLPEGVIRIDLRIEIAGRRFSQSFPPTPNQRTTFSWDGLDAYGRMLQGAQPVTARIGYVYEAIYQRTDRFGYNGNGVPITLNPARQEMIFWLVWQGVLGRFLDAQGRGLGGWSLAVHHAYDPVERVLYLGDGGRRSANAVASGIITTVAGTGQPAWSPDGIPATQAHLSSATAAVAGPDGSLYVLDNTRIRRVGPDGIITTVASFPWCCTAGVLALGPDGSLYVATTPGSAGFYVHRVAPDGTITVVAGTGVAGSSGDGGPATQAQLGGVTALAVGPDGSLYIAALRDQGMVVRRVDPAGIISTVAGTGVWCFPPFPPCGEGGPATRAALSGADRLALGPDGSLFIGFNSRIRRVDTAGIISTVVGVGTLGFSGDGGPATRAQIGAMGGLAVGPDGTLYIADNRELRIRRVGSDGIITTVGGNGVPGTAGDGGPATQAQLRYPYGIALGPDGSLYIADYYDPRIRRLSPALFGVTAGELFITAEDGREVYVFTGTGRHLRTVDTLTGAIRYEFTYDGAGRLEAVTDAYGNVTTVERDPSGNPTGIVAPFGQRTTLALNADGYLSRVTNPAGEPIQIGYTRDGLLTSFTDPRGNTARYTYDALGRLIRTEDAAGGFKTLSRVEAERSYTVTLSNALGRATSYRVENLPTGDQRRVNTFPGGEQTELVIGSNGTRTNRLADGTTSTLMLGPDPRFGMAAPVPSATSVTTPGKLASTLTTSRTATLSNSFDPLSLLRLSNSMTLNGRTYRSTFDAPTRTTLYTSAAGRQVRAVLNPAGLPVELEVKGLLPMRVTYDARGRLETIRQGADSDGRTNRFEYDAAGYLKQITDPLGRTASFSYDLAGRVTRATQPDGEAVVFGYDANGNLASLTPPGQPAHTFAYSAVNQPTLYAPPKVDGGSPDTQYEYNTDRQLTKITRPDGQIVQLDYDTADCACGRLSSLTQARGKTTFSYDATTGNPTRIEAPGRVNLAYRFDGALPTEESWSGPVTGVVSRIYDNNFRIVSRSLNGADPLEYRYDDDGLLTRAGALTLDFDPAAGLLRGTALDQVTTAWSYNGFGEPTNFVAQVNGTPAFAVQFTRDALGRIAQKTETLGGTTDSFVYEYDLAGRLTAVTRNGAEIERYTYDGNGNRLTKTTPEGTLTATYDAQDRLTQLSTLNSQLLTTFTYTANGELRTKTVAGQTTTYEYDAPGNLISVTLPDGRLLEYVIDGRNRRIGKKVNGALVQGFLYQDQLKPIAELDGSGNVVSRFVYATGINVPDYMIKGGVTYRILTDHLGSPRLVVNAATGEIAQRIDYDTFGNVRLDTSLGFQPFGFAGGLFDADTKLIRFGLRDYDSETGRWTAKDPIGFAGGDPNLWAYVDNDPVNLIDPPGVQPWPPTLVDPRAPTYPVSPAPPPPPTGPLNLPPPPVRPGYPTPPMNPIASPTRINPPGTPTTNPFEPTITWRTPSSQACPTCAGSGPSAGPRPVGGLGAASQLFRFIWGASIIIEIVNEIINGPSPCPTHLLPGVPFPSIGDEPTQA
jgi:RHS repeat-associated protein